MSDYFAFFGLPRHLHLDTAALEKQFYTLSRKLHPDRFAAKPVAEQEEALRQSSLLNDAYRTLKEPIARTEYLLTLEGVQLEEQSRAATDTARATGTEKKQVAPPELLEEAFELNMQLEEMKMNKQMGDDDPQLRKDLEIAKANFEGMLASAQTELESLWSAWDTAVDSNDDTAKTKARDGLVALLNRRSYIRNLVRDVNAALE
ncbi:MAG: Fe-S protein assembly co-chaperone HscB [Acidobacteriaceae bacterium]|nr:Fe-S protein assembly co-chaperone HscB [Acidobacteriaceae bacterium]